MVVSPLSWSGYVIAMNETSRDSVELELLQFEFSHFNEKIRWVLDYKNIPHTRRSLLPGPHFRTIRQLTGQTATPVLRIGEHYLAGSEDIVIDLEHHFPSPPLIPAEREANVLARELEAHFDRQLGPAVRTLLFAELLQCGGYLPDMFSRGQSALARTLYRGVFPVMKPLMRKTHGLNNPSTITEARSTLQRNLDEIDRLRQDTGHLAGDAFSIADLTAAALLAPLLDVAHPDMKKPEPRPGAYIELMKAWEDHPAAIWAKDVYARHR